jgi:capsular polysaccharide export protein
MMNRGRRALSNRDGVLLVGTDVSGVSAAMSKRTFLFLQGLASPFFYRLARRLRTAGHDVLRINLSGADVVFWPELAINFHGSAREWPDFVAQVMRDRRVTDLVLFGDCRPYHRAALKIARHRDATTHIFEEGYVRPNWITLEHRGTNGYSAIPRDPQAIRALAQQLPEPRPPVELHGSFVTRSVWDVTANIIGALLWPLFPHYRWHGTEHPLLEYAGWIRRFALGPASSHRARKTIARVVDAGVP